MRGLRISTYTKTPIGQRIHSKRVVSMLVGWGAQDAVQAGEVAAGRGAGRPLCTRGRLAPPHLPRRLLPPQPQAAQPQRRRQEPDRQPCQLVLEQLSHGRPTIVGSTGPTCSSWHTFMEHHLLSGAAVSTVTAKRQRLKDLLSGGSQDVISPRQTRRTTAGGVMHPPL